MTDESITIAGLTLDWIVLSGAASLGDAAQRPSASFRDRITQPRALGLWAPRDPDLLLDQMTQDDFDSSDERMPYFGTIWPSAESLVPWILAGPALDGLRVLDLGCGLGPCGFAAAQRGAAVTFFDWEARAIEIVQASASRQGLPMDRFSFVVGDWRQPQVHGPFDLVVAADILYEERNGPAVVAFLTRALRPGGEAWIGDPGRKHAQTFPDLARDAGLSLLTDELLPPQPHGISVALLRLRRDPPAGIPAPRFGR
jgi:2-polyprenyl-3-methyl-5-hydroxy-6-metoxy-1,4-benzoquinol methylase